MRAASDIEVEIAHTAKVLAELQDELRGAIKTRRAAVLADFDAGQLDRQVLADKHGLTPSGINSILWTEGRSIRRARKPIASYPPKTRRLYYTLRAKGLGPGVARQMALAEVAP